MKDELCLVNGRVELCTEFFKLVSILEANIIEFHSIKYVLFSFAICAVLHVVSASPPDTRSKKVILPLGSGN